MKAIAKVWIFASSSGRGTYETLRYDDGTTSCNCPGWTRRVTPDGSRSCKHTRLVDMGRADDECDSTHDYQTAPAPAAPALARHCEAKPAKPTLGLVGARKLSL